MDSIEDELRSLAENWHRFDTADLSELVAIVTDAATEIGALRARLAEADRLLRIAYRTIGGAPINVDAAIKWQEDVDTWRRAVNEERSQGNG